MKKDLTAIGRIRLTLDETRRFQPIDQLDSRVMAQREPIRQFANCRMRTGGQAFQGQQRLMLVRLDSVFPCLCFAELKKMPKLVAKLGELLVVAYGQIHEYIVARYKMPACDLSIFPKPGASMRRR